MSLSHSRFVDTTFAHTLASYIICGKSLRWKEIVIMSNYASDMVRFPLYLFKMQVSSSAVGTALSTVMQMFK